MKRMRRKARWSRSDSRAVVCLRVFAFVALTGALVISLYALVGTLLLEGDYGGFPMSSAIELPVLCMGLVGIAFACLIAMVRLRQRGGPC